ncbi:MAG: type II toxin-antitoxin system HipA family toxin [Candidatus Obscuribacter phosphatis]|uniref:Type II toxin-antitoxin system HipA family toxin n=1 Tax=Candidatus Obscuribacter phosphatis TaxID=1906157 RepID=A0A8J7PFY1_9BACT|nr:type II toxin-antitoxin system HipA family toxin [Candidatus Obscuribacter phosphatis]
MKKLNVVYAGWGERFTLGVLADNGRDILFEYTAEAIKRGLELSPFKMPLSSQTFGNFPVHQLRLPGLISDSLPDGWGMLVMDRLFRRRGLEPAAVSPLDRLVYIGDTAIGALTFEPSEIDALPLEDVQLLELAQDVRHVFQADESEAMLRKLVFMGGSPHGARPKVLVNFEKNTNLISTPESGRGSPMLVKFPAQNEHKEACAIETLYCALANASGITVPAHYFFDLDEETSAFGIERFDRVEGMRVPMHTAAGAAHVDFRHPQLDYISLLRLTKFMTKDMREVLHAFERCIFNVVFNNRDDHSKNFSFLMDKDGRWTFSPAYDLTYSPGPNGEHQMDICGEARIPGRKQLMELADKTGIKRKVAATSIERIAAVSETWHQFAGELPIREKTLELIDKAVKNNRERLRQ